MLCLERETLLKAHKMEIGNGNSRREREREYISAESTHTYNANDDLRRPIVSIWTLSDYH